MIPNCSAYFYKLFIYRKIVSYDHTVLYILYRNILFVYSIRINAKNNILIYFAYMCLRKHIYAIKIISFLSVRLQ
jgi:hypothetical protein